VFCTDFSENADFAFDFVLDAARRRPGCIVHLLHVIPESDAQFWKSYIYEVQDVDAKARQDIDERVGKSYLSRVPEGVDLRVEMRVGRADEEILNFARQVNADVIIMGRQGYGALRKAFFGKVVEKVVRKAPCAVLVIPLAFARNRRH
jgi:nucleotide-binding universal stress UspA family protein